LSIIPNNRIMSMEQIFQYINKQMLETTIPWGWSIVQDNTKSWETYVAETKARKPNITTKMILEPSVAIVIETL
jgi:hypothetical protein